MAALNDLVPISIIVAILLVLVITQLPPDDPRLPERRRLLHRQPREPRHRPSLVAGASLLVDYILTVAVSISAGIAAITSAFAVLRPYRVRAVR